MPGVHEERMTHNVLQFAAAAPAAAPEGGGASSADAQTVMLWDASF